MEWQPITTVPFDTPVLVTDGQLVVAVECEKWLDLLLYHPVGFSGYDMEREFSEDELTHWMPMPEPPNVDIQSNA
jgi:hypothetical protein